MIPSGIQHSDQIFNPSAPSSFLRDTTSIAIHHNIPMSRVVSICNALETCVSHHSKPNDVFYIHQHPSGYETTCQNASSAETHRQGTLMNVILIFAKQQASRSSDSHSRKSEDSDKRHREHVLSDDKVETGVQRTDRAAEKA